MAEHQGRDRLAAARRAYQEGRLAEAETGARSALAADPDDPDGLHLLGLIALAAGKPAPAASLFSRALARARRAEFHEALGIAAMALGRTDDGIAQFRHAVAVKPGLASAHYNLGTALAGRGDAQAGIASLRTALRLDGRHAGAAANLGLELLRQGEVEAGLKHIRRAVSLAPSNPEFPVILGESYLQLRRPGDAGDAFAKAVALAPGSARAWFGLGVALTGQACHARAADAYRHALALDATLAPAHHNLGLALTDLGSFEEAEEHFRAAAALRPDDPESPLDLGDALISQNREDEALEVFRGVARRHPGNVRALRRVIYLLQSRGEFEAARRVIAELAGIPDQEVAVFCLQAEDRAQPIAEADVTRALGWRDDPRIPEQTRVDLGFALAKVLERAKRYDEAFACLSSANAVKARHEPYDPAAAEAFVRGSERVFTADFLAERASWGSASEVPLFIVGLPRSGTTLTEQIIASHPEAEGAGELFDVDHIVRELAESHGVAVPEGVGRLDARTVRGFAERYLLRRTRSFPGAGRVVDKMHMNFRYVGLMALMFPRARFVHCLRDPMDNGLSIFAQQFRPGYAYAYDLAALGHYYRLHERLMRHWAAVLPGRVLTLRYEDLVGDAETWSRRLIAFAGLEWHPDCLRFHEKERSVRSASHWQVRQPVYRTSVERWRRYERHLAPLAEALR